jgi:hypothetical protein
LLVGFDFMADSAFCIEVQVAAVPSLVSLKEKVVASLKGLLDLVSFF